MATGTVKWFNDAKGYGFITPDDFGQGPLRSPHRHRGDGYKSLPEGAKVEYEAAEGAKAPRRRTSFSWPVRIGAARARWRGARRS